MNVILSNNNFFKKMVLLLKIILIIRIIYLHLLLVLLIKINLSDKKLKILHNFLKILKNKLNKLINLFISNKSLILIILNLINSVRIILRSKKLENLSYKVNVNLTRIN